jgi:phosphoserine phosphatase
VKDILLINVFGEDKPGVTSAVTNVLSFYDATVLDIGQAVIHQQLNLGLLTLVPSEADMEALVSQVQSCVANLQMRVKFLPISEQDYQQWVDQQGKSRHIVTLLARKIEAQHLAALTAVVSQYQLNIDKIIRLSGRINLHESDQLGRACVEFSVRGEATDPHAFKKSLLEILPSKRTIFLDEIED